MNRRAQSKIFAINKFLIFLFYMYINWYKDVWGNNSLVLYGLSILLFFLTSIEVISDGRINIKYYPSTLRFFFIFIAYCLISGIFVAANFSLLFSSIITLFAYSIVCFCCWFTISKSGQTDWIHAIFILCGLICAGQLLFFGQPYYNGVIVLTLGSNNNPNTLGLVFLYAIISIVFLYEKHEKHFVLSLITIGVLFYCIVLSGARKMFISAVFFIFCWLLYMMFWKENVNNNLKKQLKWIIFILTIIIVLIRFWETFQSSALFSRLKVMEEEGVDSIRVKLYYEAFNIWKNNPFWGIGYNQYASHSQYRLYTHSTYAETLACCGIVGFIMFMADLYRTGREIICSVKYNRNNFLLVAIFFVELFLFGAQIYYYDINHMLMLVLLTFTARSDVINGRKMRNSV